MYMYIKILLFEFCINSNMFGMFVCIYNVCMNMYVWLWVEFMGRIREDFEVEVWEVWIEVWGVY